MEFLNVYLDRKNFQNQINVEVLIAGNFSYLLHKNPVFLACFSEIKRVGSNKAFTSWENFLKKSRYA